MRAIASFRLKFLIALATAAAVGIGGLAATAQTVDQQGKPKPAPAKPVAKPPAAATRGLPPRVMPVSKR